MLNALSQLDQPMVLHMETTKPQSLLSNPSPSLAVDLDLVMAALDMAALDIEQPPTPTGPKLYGSSGFGSSGYRTTI